MDTLAILALAMELTVLLLLLGALRRTVKKYRTPLVSNIRANGRGSDVHDSHAFSGCWDQNMIGLVCFSKNSVRGHSSHAGVGS